MVSADGFEPLSTEDRLLRYDTKRTRPYSDPNIGGYDRSE